MATQQTQPRPARRFRRPTVEEIAAYVAEKSYHFDPELFWAFYESKGWKVGSSPMVSWRAACVTWEKKWLERRISDSHQDRRRLELNARMTVGSKDHHHKPMDTFTLQKIRPYMDEEK